MVNSAYLLVRILILWRFGSEGEMMSPSHIAVAPPLEIFVFKFFFCLILGCSLDSMRPARAKWWHH